MTPEQRTNEFQKRQVFYDSSMVAKLNAINGKWWYSVYAWLEQGKEDTKFLVLMNKYNGEDPLDLINAALKIVLGVKKIKIGIPVLNTTQKEST